MSTPYPTGRSLPATTSPVTGSSAASSPATRSRAKQARPASSPSRTPQGSEALIDGVDVDSIAAAVQACPAVSGLYSGAVGEIGTYLPGRRVAGVQVGDDIITVQVRIRWDTPVADAAAQIRTALTQLTVGRGVDIVIADIDDPPVVDVGVTPAVSS